MSMVFVLFCLDFNKFRDCQDFALMDHLAKYLSFFNNSWMVNEYI